MTLLELTEPIFQYVCRLNRLARKSGAPSAGDTSIVAKAPGSAAPRVASLDYAVVRSEVKAMFEDLVQKSNSDVRLNAQAKKMELPLLFFVDSSRKKVVLHMQEKTIEAIPRMRNARAAVRSDCAGLLR